MPRQSLNGEGRNGKVRKRGGSSSSSSSLVRTYRLKRAVLVGKRGGGGGSSTPVPLWKMMGATSRSPITQNNAKYLEADMSKEFPVSARKLAATLWEINGVSAHRGKESLEKMKEGEVGREKRGLNLKSSKLSDPSHSPVPEGMERAKVGSHRRRASTGSQKILQPAVNSPHSVCLMEVDQHWNSHTRHRLKEVRNGLTASKELLKVLNRFWGLEEQQATCLSLFSALKAELDQACVQVTKLMQEQKGEIDFLLKRFEEEKTKEQERIQSAIASVVGELRTEKKLRKQTERLNKKLGRELGNAKASLSKATREVESERRAREILEQVCDELARGIGEDRAEVEELKKESVKVREEVEKEREMLQLADVLREERVQMKLSEAKYQFEEKNAAVDQLKTELEAYLKFKRGEETPNYERIKALEKHLRETLPGSFQDRHNKQVNGEKNKDEEQEDDEEEEEDEDDDSADSDLHSIELNMDENSKSYEWSSKGRKTICLERQTSEGIVLDFTAGDKESHKNGSLFESAWKRDLEDEIERYKMIKDLRDHIVSTSKTTSSQDFISPAKNQSHHTFSSHEPSMIADAFTVLQGTD